jgi:hypothetical protein
MSLKVVHFESTLAVLALWVDFKGAGEYCSDLETDFSETGEEIWDLMADFSDLVGVLSYLATDIFEVGEDIMEPGECIFLEMGEDIQNEGEGMSS